MIAVVGDKTLLDTTTKTGYRLCVPMLAPTHPDLIERLEIKSGKPPEIRLLSSNSETISRAYAKRGREALVGWSKNLSQTHALRHLANLNGQMAGISQETRAKSLGHSPQINENVYKRRASSSTTIDLLTHPTKEAISLNDAIEVLKQMGGTKDLIAYTAAIYGITHEEVMELLAN